MSRLLNALVQQLYVGERVGYVDLCLTFVCRADPFISGELHLSGEAATRFAEGLQITIAWVALVV